MLILYSHHGVFVNHFGGKLDFIFVFTIDMMHQNWSIFLFILCYRNVFFNFFFWKNHQKTCFFLFLSLLDMHVLVDKTKMFFWCDLWALMKWLKNWFSRVFFVFCHIYFGFALIYERCFYFLFCVKKRHFLTLMQRQKNVLKRIFNQKTQSLCSKASLFFCWTFGEIILLWKRSKKHPLIFFSAHRRDLPSEHHIYYFWK